MFYLVFILYLLMTLATLAAGAVSAYLLQRRGYSGISLAGAFLLGAVAPPLGLALAVCLPPQQTPDGQTPPPAPVWAKLAIVAWPLAVIGLYVLAGKLAAASFERVAITADKPAAPPTASIQLLDPADLAPQLPEGGAEVPAPASAVECPADVAPEALPEECNRPQIRRPRMRHGNETAIEEAPAAEVQPEAPPEESQ